MLKRNILIIFSIFYVIFTLFNEAFASKLPVDISNYVKQNIPNAKERFDSVIVVSDNVMYIPLIPPVVKNVEKIEVEYSYPENRKLSQLPEVLLLNNGYSFLKVFKDERGDYTLTKKDDLPIKVRLGLMPQDMLVPLGLKVPDSLKLTLGDILIPSKDNAFVLKENDSDKNKLSYIPAVLKHEFAPSEEFKNRKTFINPRNTKFLAVYDNTSKDPLYELKLQSMPLKIVTSQSTKVALVLYWSGKEAEIIDLNDEHIIAKIPLDANATDVAFNQKENIAYITSQGANSIYVVSLDSMQLVTVVKLEQKPSKIAYCDIDDSITFYDEHQSKIYNITKNGPEYVVQSVGSANNVSKLAVDVANVYAISRVQSQLYIFDKLQSKLISTIDLDKKPTDVIFYGTRLFILCAKEGYLDVYDTVEGKIISKEQISKDGFYSNMTLIPGENNVLITGINAKSYIIYNLDKMKLVKTQDAYIEVSNIAIIQKSERL